MEIMLPNLGRLDFRSRVGHSSTSFVLGRHSNIYAMPEMLII